MTLQGTVQDYIPELEKFVCHFAGIHYLSDRLNMQFKLFETEEQTYERKESALTLQKETLSRVNWERILFDELIKTSPQFSTLASMMLNILTKTGIKGLSQNKYAKQLRILAE